MVLRDAVVVRAQIEVRRRRQAGQIGRGGAVAARVAHPAGLVDRRLQDAVEPVAAVAHFAVRRVALGVAAGVGPHVAVHRELQRRARVAEQVVDRAEPRRDVVPVRRGRDARRRPLADEPAARQGAAGPERVDLRLEVVPPGAGVDRQPVERPGVLHVDAAVGPHRGVPARRVVQGVDPVAILAGDGRIGVARLRKPAVGPDVDVARPVAGVAVVAERPLHPRLEVVRAGDVRQRRVRIAPVGRRDPDVAPVVVGLAPGGEVADDRVGEPRPGLVVAGRVVARRRDARAEGARRVGPQVRQRNAVREDLAQRRLRLVGDEQPLVDLRVAHLEQRAAADGGGPLGLERVVVGLARIAEAGRLDRLAGGRELPLLPLEDAVEVRAHLVALRDLRGQAQQGAADVLLGDGPGGRLDGRMVRRAAGARGLVGARERRAALEVVLDDFRAHVGAQGRLEGAGEQLVDRDGAGRGEVPQPVLQDRAADRRVDVVDVGDALVRRQAEILDLLGEVVGLPAFVQREADVVRPADLVAAVLRDHVQPEAAGGHLGVVAGGGHRHLLAQRLVVVVHDQAVAHLRVDDHAVDLHGGVARGGPVHRHADLLHHLRPADVRPGQAHALREVADRLRVARRRQRVDGVACDDLGPRRALHVDDRRFAGDGDRLFERADRELAVDRDVGRRLDLDPLLHEGREAGQRHGDGVDARPQIDDVVPAGAVGDRDARPLDQRRAGGFHGDARQDAARVVGDLARQRALGDGGGRQQRHGRGSDKDDFHESHTDVSSSARCGGRQHDGADGARAAHCRATCVPSCRAPPDGARGPVRRRVYQVFTECLPNVYRDAAGPRRGYGRTPGDRRRSIFWFRSMNLDSRVASVAGLRPQSTRRRAGRAAARRGRALPRPPPGYGRGPPGGARGGRPCS